MFQEQHSLLLYSSLICLLLAAALGVLLLIYVLNNKPTPKGLAFIHGPLAALGLILLIVFAFIAKPAPIISILIFVLAALMGVMLIFRDLTGRSLPKWLALTHGITAILAFLILLAVLFYY